MRCPQCATDNPADYRFCGTCGTPLEKAVPVSEPVTRSAAPRQESVTVPPERASQVERFSPSSRSNGGSSLLGLNDPRRAERPAAQKPVEHVVPERRVPAETYVAPEKPAIEERLSPQTSTISGPSFLGLGSNAPHGGYGETSRDLNYLFEDDEQPRRSYGRFIAIMLVLAICGGLAYLQYRRGGNSWTAPWSKGPAQTPVQASQPQPGDQTNAASGANNASAPAPGQTPTADQTTNAQDKSAEGSLKEKDLPLQGGASTNGEQGTAAPGTAAGAAAAGGTQGAATSNSPGDSAAKDEKTSKSSDETTETASATPPAATGARDTGAKDKGAAATKETESASAANDNEEAAADVPAKTPKPARTKPTPQVAPANPDDALVTNAEKYLYGRGVPQNCDRALISLRAAANRQNSRAMTLLGTMFGTGHCVSRDLPNSYRWFAQASRQSPDNTWITRNLEMIWREMTPAERQLATARQ